MNYLDASIRGIIPKFRDQKTQIPSRNFGTKNNKIRCKHRGIKS